MRPSTTLSFLLRPWLYHELPGWGRLYRWLGLDGIDNTNPRWRQAPTRTIRGKWHGYLMRLDLRDDLDRMTYFLGRYMDLEIQLLLDVLLREGDTLLDVGANVGRNTLHASRRVGSQGRVIAVEPQAACCRRIEQSLQENAIQHVQVHNVGLSDTVGELALKVLGGGTVMSTFAIDEAVDRAHVRQEVKVPVLRGDSLVADQVRGHLTIKIDVEGYELHVLRGLTETLAGHRPVVLTEVEPRFLRRAGTDEGQLFTFFAERGYTAWVIGLRRRWCRWSLRLRRIGSLQEFRDIDESIDVVWVPPACERFDPAQWS